MSKLIEKIDKNTVRITETVQETKTAVSTYPYDDLKSQLNLLLQEKTEWNAKQDVKITDLQNIIAQADGLGIVASADLIIP